MYFYLFYQLFKWYEKGPSIWWSDWKANITVDILIYFLFLPIFIYYKIYINPYVHLSGSYVEVIIIGLSICVPNYLIFHHRNQWKKIVEKFDKLPSHSNKIGGWITFFVVLGIFFNMVFAFYQMSLIDWSPYR